MSQLLNKNCFSYSFSLFRCFDFQTSWTWTIFVYMINLTFMLGVIAEPPTNGSFLLYNYLLEIGCLAVSTCFFSSSIGFKLQLCILLKEVQSKKCHLDCSNFSLVLIILDSFSEPRFLRQYSQLRTPKYFFYFVMQMQACSAIQSRQ